MFRIERLCTPCVQSLIVNKVRQIRVVHLLDFVQLMRCAETVKEMNERYKPLDCRKMCHACKVHDLLNIAARKKGKSRLTAVIYIRMVSEYGERVGADRTAGHMKYARETLTGYTVHSRDHQHKSLRRSETCRQGSGLKCAVNGCDRAGFRLHLNEADALTEDVLLSVGRPDVCFSRHRRGRCNWINSRYFSECICNISGGFITVHRHILLLSVTHNVFLRVSLLCQIYRSITVFPVCFGNLFLQGQATMLAWSSDPPIKV